MCSYCGKAFYTQKNLLVHERIHTKPFACIECGKTFSEKWILTRHISSHHEAGSENHKYSCEICQKSFTRKQNLMQHSKSHENKTCKICHKSFINVSRLKRHEIIHSSLRPFLCKLCGKSFNQKANLTAHERIHSNPSKALWKYSRVHSVIPNCYNVVVICPPIVWKNIFQRI